MATRAVSAEAVTAAGLPIQLVTADPGSFITVAFENDPEPTALLPVALVQGSSAGELVFGPGTIWFSARRLAANAADGYIGMLVDAGTITLSPGSPLAVQPAHSISLAQNGNFRLTVTPQRTTQSAEPEPSSFTPPDSATFEATASTASVTITGKAECAAWGVTVSLSPAAGPAVYSTDTQSVAIPMSATPATFATGRVPSDGQPTVQVGGAAEVLGAFWSLPVSQSPADVLGEAAGPGAALVQVSAGLSFNLGGRAVGAGPATLLIGVGEVSASASAAHQLPLTVELWQRAQAAPARLKLSPSGGLLSLAQSASLELLQVTGAVTGQLDRPRFADGSPVAIDMPEARLFVRRVGAILSGGIAAFGSAGGHSPGSLCLANAMVLIDKAPSYLLVTGTLSGTRIASGTAEFAFPVRAVLPTLPDPYAANFDVTNAMDEQALAPVTVVARWGADGTAELDARWQGEDGLGISGVQGGFRLLDLSTNADLLGVATLAELASISSEMLAVAGRELVVFTVPGIAWEPVIVTPGTPAMPAPPGDGQPTELRAATAGPVPVEPTQALAAFTDVVRQSARDEQLQASFMLPQGILAEIEVATAEVTDQGARLELVQPAFPGAITGGRQLLLSAPHPQDPKSGFRGGTEFIDQAARTLLAPADVPFGTEFGLGGQAGIVPLKRVDLSGYGTSTFSRWSDIDAQAAVSQIRFDVIVGRLCYEVVQIVSVIYPWGIRVVRTITFERLAGGQVLRSDSGWQPTSDGRMDLPAGVTTHAGPITALVNVHDIADTSTVISPSPGLEFEQVTFGADALISPDLLVREGGRLTVAGMVMPSAGVTGYLQRLPVGAFISLEQLNLLMTSAPPAQAPLSGLVDAGGAATPGLQMRVSAAAAGIAGPETAPRLVGSLAASPRLPAAGAFTLASQPSGASAPQALPPRSPVPLIRPNGDASWHLADPADVEQLTAPAGTVYGLLQDTGTQKVFLRRLSTPTGSQHIDLAEPPHLADVAALLGATGAFPELAGALKFDVPPQVTAAADTLTVQRHSWSLAGEKPRELLSIGPADVLISYQDSAGNPAQATVVIDPGRDPAWSIDVGIVSLLVALPPFGSQDDPLLTITGSLHADADSAPGYRELTVHFGGALSLVQQVFTRLEQLASFLPGGGGTLDVAFSGGRLSIRDTFTLPNLPLGLGEVTDVTLDLGATIALSPRELDFSVGICTPDRPFHWVVSPLSGTGCLQVGAANGDPKLLVQGGLGLGLGIDVGVAAGSASVVLALQVDNRVAPLELKVILTGQASVEVIGGVASASLMLSAALGIAPDRLPLPHQITLFGDVAVGIHISICWVVDIDFDGSWHFSQTMSDPLT
jgi:hypothetical protein